jgi:hypothetical protein
MGRVNTAQTNFTAGEISPRLLGRTDVDRYANAAEELTNAYPVVHGGAKRRGGTLFVAEARSPTVKARLVPFVKSRDISYMLEFGDSAIRVYRSDGTYTGTEVPCLFNETMLHDVDYVQGEDAMYLAHPLLPIQRLRRFTDTYWDISAAPFSTTPFDEVGQPVGATLTLSAATVGAGRTFTASVASFLASDVGRNIICDAGLATITGYTSTTVVTATIVVGFSSTTLLSGAYMDVSPQTDCTPGAKDPVGTITTLTLGAAGWRITDVGKFVRINGGLLKITGFTSTTVVNAKILSELTSTVGAPALSWSLESDMWGPTWGYPCTITLHEQRLIAAGTTKFPQTIWGTRTGEITDFTRGTSDDDGFQFTIANDEVNPISFVASLRHLTVNTHGGEFSVRGGLEKPLTPTNVRVVPESGHGAKGVRPVVVGKESLFVQRAGRKVRAMGYRYDVDGFAAPDLSVLAEHITSGGIVQMAYQQEPDTLLWCVRGDGALLSCTLDRDQSVIGWAKHFTQGWVESAASIPVGERDQTWLLVRRKINGATVRYLERIDDTFEPALPGASDPDAPLPIDAPKVYGCTVDCGIVVDNVLGQTTFTGLSHLESATVQVLSDGAAMGAFVVTGGSITLPRASMRTLIGLGFTSTITPPTPEAGSGAGTAQGTAMSTAEVTVRLLDTVGGKVIDAEGHEEELPTRAFGVGVLDQPPGMTTGIRRTSTLGWDYGRSHISIVQDQPLPMHVLAVIRRFTSNEG